MKVKSFVNLDRIAWVAHTCGKLWIRQVHSVWGVFAWLLTGSVCAWVASAMIALLGSTDRSLCRALICEMSHQQIPRWQVYKRRYLGAVVIEAEAHLPDDWTVSSPLNTAKGEWRKLAVACWMVDLSMFDKRPVDTDVQSPALYCAGWPLPAFGCTYDWMSAAFNIDRGRPVTGVSGGVWIGIRERGSLEPRIIPFTPQWKGLTVNTLVFALIASMLTAIARGCIATHRMREGCCPMCGYCVYPSDSMVCPECGLPCREWQLAKDHDS